MTWFEWVWENYDKNSFFRNYLDSKGHEWADDDLKALLDFLTGYKSPGLKNNVSGYKKIRVRELQDLHTSEAEDSFTTVIPESLRNGIIIIVDLSQGSPSVQSLFSEKICQSFLRNRWEDSLKTSQTTSYNSISKKRITYFLRKKKKT